MLAAIVIAYLRFFQDRSRDPVLGDLTEITLIDGADQGIPMNAILEEGKTTFVFLMELENCDSCLLTGTNELGGLAAAGHPVRVVVVNDWSTEVAGWAKHFPQFPFYRMARDQFYAQVRTDGMPVMMVFRDGELDNARIIRL